MARANTAFFTEVKVVYLKSFNPLQELEKNIKMIDQRDEITW